MRIVVDDGSPSRRDLIRRAGAGPAVVEELLAYTESPYRGDQLASLTRPLADEPHLDAWTEYAAEARRSGTIAALARRFAQLRFPIEAGISQTEAYRAATRRGRDPGADVRVTFRQPDAITLSLHATPAGRIPILVAPDRDDFVALVRAFTARNEPEPIPSSMGACIVTGLTNWDRVARYRARFEAERGAEGGPAAWEAEFPRLAANKPLYQDRFIILSRGPYSAVSAGMAGFDAATWLERSDDIRRAHECTHYLTLRLFGQMRSNLLDELVADTAGLVAAFGRFEARLARLFLGLEDYPRYRPGGRFENYLGSPRLSDEAARVLRTVVVQAIEQIEAWLATGSGSTRAAGAVVGLLGLSLEQIAAGDLAARLGDRRRGVPVDGTETFG